MRQKPERFGRLRLEETTSTSPRNLEDSSNLPRFNEEANVPPSFPNKSDLIERRTETPPECQVTVRSDVERPNESRIRITASTQDIESSRHTGTKGSLNIAHTPEFSAPTFERTDASVRRKNGLQNRQYDQTNSFSPLFIHFNASFPSPNRRKPNQEDVSNSNLNNLAKNIAGETLGPGSKVIAVTPAPRDTSLNKESFQSRRIVVNHPFETIREVVEHKPYTKYHEKYKFRSRQHLNSSSPTIISRSRKSIQK